MERRDWTLLAIAAGKGASLSPVQLQKSLFLLGQNLPKEVGKRFYKFVPYDYGPFCSDIYADAEELAADHLVDISYSAMRRWREYSATPLGLARADELRAEVSSEAVQYLEKVVAWTRQVGFASLVSTIYRLYPDFKVNSVFTQS